MGGHLIDAVVSTPYQAPAYRSPDSSARSLPHSRREPGLCFRVCSSAALSAEVPRGSLKSAYRGFAISF